MEPLTSSSDRLSIPEEAIEAAALALRSPSRRPGPPDRDLMEIWKRTARITLEAAAPLIVAAALNQIADQIAAEEGSGSFSSGVLRAVVTIQRRAAELRGEGGTHD